MHIGAAMSKIKKSISEVEGIVAENNCAYIKKSDVESMIQAFATANGLTYNQAMNKLDKIYNSASDLISALNVGWNLGNTLENTSTIPYSEDILKRNVYKIGAYVLDAPGKQFLVNSSASTPLQPNVTSQTVTATITSVLSADYARIPTRFRLAVANYFIGDCGLNALKLTVTGCTIKLAGGQAQTITEVLKEHSFIRSVSGDSSATVDVNFANYGVDTAEKLVNAVITYTVSVSDWWTPIAPITEGQWFEKLLNNPITTKDILQGIKDKGFNAIRIPTNWFNHTDQNGLIKDSWLAHVKQIVEWCLEIDMYVIINMHHDGHGGNGWIQAYTTQSQKDTMLARYRQYWTQIATYFKDLDQRLIFEGYNEVLDTGSSWAAPSLAEQATLDLLAQTFVDVVRATGSINANRVLCINTYGATCNYADMVLPTDSVANKLIVQVHLYNPQDFCFLTGSGTGNTSVVAYNAEGAHGLELDGLFDSLKTRFVDNGIPVIIGEFASYNKSLNTVERVEHATSYITKAKARGIKCFWWDAGGDSTRADAAITTGALYKRASRTWWFEDIPNALVAASKSV